MVASATYAAWRSSCQRTRRFQHISASFLALMDAFIAQAERCGLDLGDALSEVKLRARIRRKKGEAKELEKIVRREMRRKAMRAAEEEKARKKGKRT